MHTAATGPLGVVASRQSAAIFSGVSSSSSEVRSIEAIRRRARAGVISTRRAFPISARVGSSSIGQPGIRINLYLSSSGHIFDFVLVSVLKWWKPDERDALLLRVGELLRQLLCRVIGLDPETTASQRLGGRQSRCSAFGRGQHDEQVSWAF